MTAVLVVLVTERRGRTIVHASNADAIVVGRQEDALPVTHVGGVSFPIAACEGSECVSE